MITTSPHSGNPGKWSSCNVRLLNLRVSMRCFASNLNPRRAVSCRRKRLLAPEFIFYRLSIDTGAQSLSILPTLRNVDWKCSQMILQIKCLSPARRKAHSQFLTTETQASKQNNQSRREFTSPDDVIGWLFSLSLSRSRDIGRKSPTTRVKQTPRGEFRSSSVKIGIENS